MEHSLTPPHPACVCVCRRTSCWWSSETWSRPTHRSALSSCRPPSTPPCSESTSSTVPSSRCSDELSLFKVEQTSDFLWQIQGPEVFQNYTLKRSRLDLLSFSEAFNFYKKHCFLEFCLIHVVPLSAEYFLEDCIQMTNFVPPPMDRKKKDKDEEGGDDDVRSFWYQQLDKDNQYWPSLYTVSTSFPCRNMKQKYLGCESCHLVFVTRYLEWWSLCSVILCQYPCGAGEQACSLSADQL